MAASTSGDFWDGFHAEEEEAGVQPPVAAEASAAVQPAQADIRLEESLSTDEPAKVGGWGSGLFNDEDDPSYPPAFGGSDVGGDSEGGDSEERDRSYYDGDETSEDRGWSYDDPVPDDKSDGDEEAPAFRSPAADRDELVEKSSRFKDMTSWRPSVPSFGGSSIGMRARGALEVLDAILEENGTEDIPRPLLVGLMGLVGVLALIALVAFIF